ncbi:uncharacterized protein FIBRA_06036 [Fibroporia radiculosa]|uniref:Uncharacterized protein n=1 Tax=Fibroporia radiculosa TaxID=599839 RepID=J4GS32_9APHY|nr:uncharacterized protein FIBRA_06036 [Fibroporia radiculosa]CCM03885.1 predicted protein [Fibroporia radiculosa]
MAVLRTLMLTKSSLREDPNQLDCPAVWVTMPKSYRVFTGAPSIADLNRDPNSYHWRTVSSAELSSHPLPPATLEAASRRISLLYQNIIFHNDSDEDDQEKSFSGDVPERGVELSEVQEQTTAITWLPTQENVQSPTASKTGTTFLQRTSSRVYSQFETQGTQEGTSYNYSDASSIARFPSYHFSLHALASLSFTISGLQAQAARSGPSTRKLSQRCTILVAVLEVEGPDTIRIKKGVEAGKEVSLLRMILGSEDGAICKLTAWREVAESWGGADPDEPTTRIKRGDVVHLENILASWSADQGTETGEAIPITLTASPYLKSRLEICYRTMPDIPEDSRFRPDLRLGFSDAAVRRVAAVVRWFQEIAGLPLH